MKDLKYEHQSTFLLWGGGSNFILGTGSENQIFILRSPAVIRFFHQILKNCHFGVKNKSLPTQMDFNDPYMVSYSIPFGYYNFARGTNKIPIFWHNFHIWKKNCWFNEKPKIWAPKYFSCVRKGQT